MSGWTRTEHQERIAELERLVTWHYQEMARQEEEERREAAEVLASMEALRKQEEQELLEAAIALGVLRSTRPSTPRTSTFSGWGTTTPASTSAWGGRLRPRQVQNTSKGTSTTKTP